MRTSSLVLVALACLAPSSACGPGPAAAPPVEPAAASPTSTPERPPQPIATSTPGEPATEVETGPRPLTPEEIQAIVAASDRAPEDRETDARRAPAELLAFAGIGPGMQAADIAAGTGYTTELLARAVGPSGRVYGQNSQFILDRFAEPKWSERLAKPVNARVVRLDRPFDDPFPAEVENLDAVVNVLFYHDFAWMKVDRAAHNRAVFEALRPGGRYVVVDHHALPGSGARDSESLHRIEEDLVIAELRAAGFELEKRGEFLRNPRDTRDWNAVPWRNDRTELSDKFVLSFRKPT